jgi:thymidine phosphorylase
MVERAGAERGLDAARARVRRTLDDGSAWEKFLALVRAQGGDSAAVERGALARAPEVADVRAARAGTLEAIDTFALGRRVVEMGGGRAAKADVVDPRVGVEVLARIGDPVGAGAPLARVHVAADPAGWAQRIAACFTVGDGRGERIVRVIERID